MKNLLKKFSFVFLVLGLAFAVVGCKPDDDDEHTHSYSSETGLCSCGQKDPNWKPQTHTHNFVDGVCSCGEVDPDYVPVLEYPEYTDTETVGSTNVNLADYKYYVASDLEALVESIGSLDNATMKVVVEAAQAGLDAFVACKDVKSVNDAYDAAVATISNAIPKASGLITYGGLSTEEKTEILGILEAYAVRNGITGISLFENGGYTMYNPRVTLGTENYIVGYGFGTLAEGNITAPLETENNDAWKMYYHSTNAADPGTANYLNDQGSEVSDFSSYFVAAFYTTFMNATKDGYDWVPELAMEKPVAQNLDENGQATIWKFQVRTGNEGLKYTTNSTIASRAAFNNRPVAAEDYETAFKVLLTQSNGLFRGSEFANNTSYAIKGAKEFYDATKDGYSEEAWANVGVNCETEADGKTYFTVEFKTPKTDFYAMYYISSSLWMPIPQEFIDLVTIQNYLGFNEDKSETPVDNALSLGAYALERWDSEQQVVYKKNPNYVYADTKYAIEGIHINILTALATDAEANFNEFLAGRIDATGIPQTKLAEYKNDPRTRTTKGNSNFKLNVNATDAETWEYLFGENGVVTQTPKENYWVVEPALSNKHFIKALSYSINRLEFASARGSVPSVDYLSSNYMSDPVNNISYSATEAHRKAVAALLEDTDGYGFSLELARENYRIALAELEAAGLYTPGTVENPTIIELEIAWMYPQHEELYHAEIAQYLEDAFNHESVHGGKYKLVTKFWVGNQWSDVYYYKMMLGQYDLGFGSITGDPLNPLAFLNVLSSDQVLSGSFTLNWGTDTNNVDADLLVYNGQRWSFDALWVAANSKAIVEDGSNTHPFTATTPVVEKQEDGSNKVTIDVKVTFPEFTTVEASGIELYNYATQQYVAYDESTFTQSYNEETGVLTVVFTMSAEGVAQYPYGADYIVYLKVNIDGYEETQYVQPIPVIEFVTE